jgi:hypothetical protein
MNKTMGDYSPNLVYHPQGGIDIKATAKKMEAEQVSVPTIKGHEISTSSPPSARKTEILATQVLNRPPIPPRPTNFKMTITHQERQQLRKSLSEIDFSDESEVAESQESPRASNIKTKEEKAVEHSLKVVNEVFTTEKTIGDLSKLATEVLNESFVAEFPEAKEVTEYFQTMSKLSNEVVSVLKEINQSLEGNKSPETIREGLAKLANSPELKKYFEHMGKAGEMQIKASALQNLLKANPAYTTFIKKAMTDTVNAPLSKAMISAPETFIQNVSILFVQRGPRFVLFARDLEARLNPPSDDTKSPFLKASEQMASSVNENTRNYETGLNHQELKDSIESLKSDPKLKLALNNSGKLETTSRNTFGSRNSVGTSEESQKAGSKVIELLQNLSKEGIDVTQFKIDLKANGWYEGVMINNPTLSAKFNEVGLSIVKGEQEHVVNVDLQPQNTLELLNTGALGMQVLGAAVPPKDKEEMYPDPQSAKTSTEPQFASMDNSFAAQADIILKDFESGGVEQPLGLVLEGLQLEVSANAIGDDPNATVALLSKLNQGILHLNNVLDVKGRIGLDDLQHVAEAKELLKGIQVELLANSELRELNQKLESTLQQFDEKRTDLVFKRELSSHTEVTDINLPDLGEDLGLEPQSHPLANMLDGLHEMISGIIPKAKATRQTEDLHGGKLTNMKLSLKAKMKGMSISKRNGMARHATLKPMRAMTAANAEKLMEGIKEEKKLIYDEKTNSIQVAGRNKTHIGFRTGKSKAAQTALGKFLDSVGETLIMSVAQFNKEASGNALSKTLSALLDSEWIQEMAKNLPEQGVLEKIADLKSRAEAKEIEGAISQIVSDKSATEATEKFEVLMKKESTIQAISANTKLKEKALDAINVLKGKLLQDQTSD